MSGDFLPFSGGANVAAAAAPQGAPVVSARAFGAVGDGATDDTAAINAACASGTIVVLPAGRYAVATSVVVPAGTTLTLDPGAVIVPTGNQPLRVFGVVRANRDGAGVDASQMTSAAFGGCAVLLYAAGTECNGLTITGVPAGVAAISNGYGSLSKVRAIDNVISSTAGGAGPIAVRFEAANGGDAAEVVVRGNDVDFSGCPNTITNQAIVVLSTAGHYMPRAEIAHNIVRMPSNPGNTGALCIVARYATDAVIIGNRCIGGSMGISFDTSTGGTITGNSVYGSNWTGIEVASSQYAVVADNVIDGAGLLQYGIITDGTNGTCDDNVIRGNQLRGGKASSNGIYLSTTSPGTLVEGNQVRGFTYPISYTAANATVCAIRSNPGHNPVGAQSAPAMPASGAALTNPFPYDCTVYVGGGTVTGIAVAGTTTGITAGTVRVLAGQTITLTYTAAPTVWAWQAE